MRFTVLVTRPLFPESERLLRRQFRITRDPAAAQGILTRLTDIVDARLFDAAPRLRVVSQCAAGVDNVDLSEAARRGIAVMNTPGVLTEATADLTWALILSVARRIPEADRLCRAGGFSSWDLHALLGFELTGATLGIVGPGRIGTAVARRARGFGMSVLRSGRGGPKAASVRSPARVGLEALLRASDIVTLHVPSSPETFKLIGRRELALMKSTAILVNTSRGSVVDERALIDALRRGQIAGAGLDVYEREPRIPAALKRMPQVVLTPHIGSATRRTRGAMAGLAVTNLIDFFAGRPDR